MTMAAIAAPVAPPTTPAIPATAKPDTLLSIPGKHQFRAMPYAAPNVAPMNSEGEKIPPDAPEPSVRDVTSSFSTKSSSSRWNAESVPVSTSWMVAVSDSLNVVVTPLGHQEIHDDSHQKHPRHVARVVVSLDALLEKILEGVDRLDVAGGNDAQQDPQSHEGKEQPEVGHVEVGRFQGRNHERGVWPEERAGPRRSP